MSERNNSTPGCAVVVIAIFIIMLCVWVALDYRDISDLQRRVGQLEEQVKQ